MSIDLDVFVVKTPKNLRDRWQDAFATLGMVCEFRPDFDPATWGGSDLVAKMSIKPGAFDGADRYGSVPFITGCGMELWHAPEFDDERDDVTDRCPKPLRAKLGKATQKFFFTTSMGRSPDAWRFQVFAAATLTQITDGLFYSPQTSEFNTGEEAVKLAIAEAAELESQMATKLKPGKGWSLRPFKTWRAALKDATPEYTDPE
jgi:hypothetical protein